MLIFMMKSSGVNNLLLDYQHKLYSIVGLCDLAFAYKVILTSGFFLIET